MANVVLVSWNVNGLVGVGRLEQFLTHLEILGYPDFVFLQEIHANNRHLINRWEEMLDNYKCYFNHGDGRNKGTGILIKKSTPFYLNINGLVQDLDGRYTILKGKLGDRLVTLVSVYAPVEKVERSAFFGKLLGNNLDGILYLMGDYNSVVMRSKDRTYSRNRVGEDLELIDFMQKSDTKDVWRELHVDKVEYSYVHPVASSRIDLCLVSPEVLSEFMTAEYIPTFSDHKLLKVETILGKQLIGSDFIKIKPHVILDTEFRDTFQGFWWEQKRVFYNTLTHKMRRGTFQGSLERAIYELQNDSDLTTELFLDNIILNSKWWDKFKKRIFLCGRITRSRIAKKKNGQYNTYLNEYYSKNGDSEGKRELERKLREIVLSINKEMHLKHRSVTEYILRGVLLLFSVALNRGKNHCIWGGLQIIMGMF